MNRTLILEDGSEGNCSLYRDPDRITREQDMNRLSKRLQKLEAICPPVFCDGSKVIDVAQAKMTMDERILVCEYRAWKPDKVYTEAQRAAYAKWERSLAEATEETGFPIKMQAIDWDVWDREAEEALRRRKEASRPDQDGMQPA
jgi:hypothetical protein